VVLKLLQIKGAIETGDFILSKSRSNRFCESVIIT
jgi:hypothetical protein